MVSMINFMRSQRLVRSLCLVGCLLCALAIGALVVEADVAAKTTRTVTNTNDSGAGSLRDALANANDGDTVAFSLTTPATITLTTGELVIEDDLTISGPGADLLAISAGGVSRVINVTEPVSLTIEGLTIRDGYVLDESGGGMLLAPGCHLTLTASALVTNTADGRHTGGGGALYATDSTCVLSNTDIVDNLGGSIPGALFIRGNTTLEDCLIVQNIGEWGLGVSIDGGLARFTNCTVLSNTWGIGIGLESIVTISGGRFAWNDLGIVGGTPGGVGTALTVTDVLFEHNETAISSGGWPGTTVIERCQFLDNQHPYGGGTIQFTGGTLHLSESLFERNATNSGGALYTFEEGCEAVYITNCQFISNSATYVSGAIESHAPLTITGCLFQGNSAGEVGGAIHQSLPGYAYLSISDSSFISNTAGHSGGAIMNWGQELTMTHCTVLSNTAGEEGGAICNGYVATDEPRGQVALYDTHLQGNRCITGTGGAIATLTGPVQAERCTWVDNMALNGGAIHSDGGRVTLTDCALVTNHAVEDGGALYCEEVDRVILTDTDVVSNTATNGGGLSGSAAKVVITGTLLEGNTASAQGGAINLHADLLVTGTQFISNACGTLGGGAWVWGDTAIDDTRFERNEAGSAWGALGIVEGRRLDVARSQFVGNQADGVGALFMSHGTLDRVLFAENSATNAVGACSAGGPVTITNSSFVSNTSQMSGMLVNTYDLDIINTTFRDNASTGAGPGAIQAVGPMTLTHCTLANNVSDSGAGGINSQLGGATLVNTILANNTSTYGDADLAGEFMSGGHNLIGIADGSTGFAHGTNGDLVGSASSPVDPLLGPLGDYGGETPTLPLLPGSPAIDAGDASGPPQDQRGLPRVGRTDIGAFEARGFALTALSGYAQSAPVLSFFPSPLLVGVSSGYGDPVDGGQVTFGAPLIGPSANLSPQVSTIQDGQASIIAIANGLEGSYVVQAVARGAKAVRIFRPGARDVEPTAALAAAPSSTAGPTSTPPPVVMEPVTFTLTNLVGPVDGLWLPLVIK